LREILTGFEILLYLQSMEIELIDTGYFYADGGAMFGAVPKSAWQKRYPSDAMNKCVLAMRSALVHTDDGRLILIDNGAGNKHLRQMSYYRFFNLVDLYEELAKRGIRPEQITDMVLTHLHFDHCGYTTLKNEAIEADETDEDGEALLQCGRYVPAFPNARHWISRAQWDNCRRPSHPEKDSYFVENVEAILSANKLRLVDADTALCSGVSLRLYGGHTPGQLVPYIYTPGRTFVFAGDVIPLAPSVSPEWISAYDAYPITSYYEKVRMLEEAAAEKQALIFCHDAYTRCSTIKKVGNFYKTDETIALIQK
jgi:glyoxylase-like metal-dependent hydrolase (beta-lactamase superfamily II)